MKTLLLSLFLSVAALLNAQVNYYVSVSGSDANNGTESSPFASVDKAFVTIQAAFDADNSALQYTVNVGEGDYTVSDLSISNAQLAMSITLKGAGANVTTLSGGSSYPSGLKLFANTNSTNRNLELYLEDLTIRNYGFEDASVGGIINVVDGAAQAIVFSATRCVFTKIQARDGAIFTTKNKLFASFRECSFMDVKTINNEGVGSIMNFSRGALTIENCFFSHCSKDYTRIGGSANANSLGAILSISPSANWAGATVRIVNNTIVNSAIIKGAIDELTSPQSLISFTRQNSGNASINTVLANNIICGTQLTGISDYADIYVNSEAINIRFSNSSNNIFNVVNNFSESDNLISETLIYTSPEIDFNRKDGELDYDTTSLGLIYACAKGTAVVEGALSAVQTSFDIASSLRKIPACVGVFEFVPDGSKKPQLITFEAIAPIKFSEAGDITLEPLTSAGLVITYTSSDETVAAIVDGNTLRPMSKGMATITATQAGNEEYAEAESISQEVLFGGEAGVYTSSDLGQYGKADWYRDAKLGFMMHLSPVTPATTDCKVVGGQYASKMYQSGSVQDYHISTYGPLSDFGFKDFIPMLTLSNFDADYYADLCVKVGAGYLATAAVHHDGFAMWDSEEITYNAVDMGPKRDVVGELTEALKKKGIKAGVSTHYGRHWKYYTFDSIYDNWDPAYEGLYGKRRAAGANPTAEDVQQWERVMKELIDLYEPDYTFVDGGISDAASYFHDAFYDFVTYYYNKSSIQDKQVAITYKRDFLKTDEAIWDGEGESAIHNVRLLDEAWQVHVTPKSAGWFYGTEEVMKNPGLMVMYLVDVVSRNGNLILNLAPKSDGVLPQGQENYLLTIGEWMEVNKEGIKGTRPWMTFGQGVMPQKGNGSPSADAIRFTQKGDSIYAFFPNWASDNFVIPQSYANNLGPIEQIEMLGSAAPLEWSFLSNGDLSIATPAAKPCDHVWGLKIVAPTKTPVVSLCQGGHYDGWCASFVEGKYTNAQLLAAGGDEDDVSSVRVQDGYRLTLYADDNFLGDSVIFTSDKDILDLFDNKTSSLKVEALANTALKSHSYSYNLFPNPAKNTLNITAGSQLKGGEYKLYSLQGNLMKSGALIQEHTQLDVSMLHPGLYVIKMSKGANHIIDRFVVE